MRFVEPKSTDQQARAVAFRTREQLVKQRTESVNALRSHLYEFGHVAPVGIGYLPRLERVVEDPEANIPDLARDICRMLIEHIPRLADRTRAAAASAIAEIRHWSSRLQRREFASAANFPRSVIGGRHQPPNPLPSFAAPSTNWEDADKPA